MTTIGVIQDQYHRVDALRFPSYNYHYPAFRKSQISVCIPPSPIFRGVDADRKRRLCECKKRQGGPNRAELEALKMAAEMKESKKPISVSLREVPMPIPAEPKPDLLARPRLNAKEYARWRFETTPVVTTQARAEWNCFLNRCPERFNIELPEEISGDGTQRKHYYDRGYSLPYLRPHLTRGWGLEPYNNQPLGVFYGPADISPYRSIRVTNNLIGQ
ncbi:uncharacterized protein LOC131945811 isoform X2 [Physella acuta]|uniref:uncharacterized protein LOC131945811 isoform X2 n=1 Tax=Physella acuta TaxID=109671 RepID=UPI0027DD2EA1|nr:uncharacterized protein LOC131945811 isoform X2 [Physella acuta]XP_059162395.1 uncharacterized protein LOC131945811 isoform X2 [Physella acuta]